MKTSALLLVPIVLLMSCGRVGEPVYPVEQLRVYVDETEVGYGNAFVVGYDENGTILATARHVATSGNRLYVKTSRKSYLPRLIEADVFFIDPTKDIAYVRINEIIYGLYKTCEPVQHERIWIVSRGKGVWDHNHKATGYERQEGTVIDINGNLFLFSGWVVPGYSGSPVVSAKRGCVIGVVSSHIRDTYISLGTSF